MTDLLSAVGSKPLLIGSFVFLLGTIGYTLILVVTGSDYYSLDGKEFESVKDDCEKLKQYILDNYGSWKYEEATDRFEVMCK